MSSDYRTPHYAGYHHDEGVAVFTAGDHQMVGWFTPELVSELQSITDQWRETRAGSAQPSDGPSQPGPRDRAQPES